MFDVAARLNNVQNTPTKPIANPVQSGSSATNTALTSSRPLNSGDSPAFGVISSQMLVSLVSAATAVVAGPWLFL